MITLLEGTPGSGKSYYGVAEYLLPWLRSGRKMYVHIDGFYLDRLAAFEGRTLQSVQEQVTLWNDSKEIPTLLPQVEPGSAICLDEAQCIFRSREKVEEGVKRWLETHRHYGVDLLLMAQDYRQMTSSVTRLVEITIKFRRMDRFGLSKSYQGFMRGNPEEVTEFRTLTGRYSPKIYQYYNSYACSSVKEERKQKSILSSPVMILGVVGLLVVLGWTTTGNWLSAAEPPKDKQARPLQPAKLPPPVTQSQLQEFRVTMAQEQTSEEPRRVVGGLRVEDGETVWLMESGESGRVEELVGLTGETLMVLPNLEGVPQLVGKTLAYRTPTTGQRVVPDYRTMERLEEQRGKAPKKVLCIGSVVEGCTRD